MTGVSKIFSESKQRSLRVSHLSFMSIPASSWTKNDIKRDVNNPIDQSIGISKHSQRQQATNILKHAHYILLQAAGNIIYLRLSINCHRLDDASCCYQKGLKPKWSQHNTNPCGERGGLVVEPPERGVRGLIPTSAVLCPRAKTHLLPEKYW